jgi:hypothetical protein
MKLSLAEKLIIGMGLAAMHENTLGERVNRAVIRLLDKFAESARADTNNFINTGGSPEELFSQLKEDLNNDMAEYVVQSFIDKGSNLN